MPVFEYVTKDLTGREAVGAERAPHVDAVVNSLHSRGLIVLSITEKQRNERTRNDVRSQLASLKIPGLSPVSVRTMALFTRQLGTMLEAGLPLVRSLKSLANDERNKTFRGVIVQIADDIERGSSLSDALGQHPRIFNNLYVNMIRAGERSGQLDHVLSHLGEYLEKVDAIRTKVKSAMAYPTFVLVFTIAATAFLLLRVVPTFAQIYANFNTQLPAPTRFVLAVSNWSKHNVPLGIGILAILVIAAALWRRTPKGAYAFDAFMIRIPVLGPLLLKTVVSRFTRTLSALFAAGVPMLDALDLVEGACGNRVFARSIRNVREKIAAGGDLADSLAEEKVVPSMVTQLAATGQESGSLDTMLLKAAHFCDQQVDAGVATLTSMIEPVLIVFMGFIVGGLVITMFLPVFTLGQAIQNAA